MSEPSSRDSSAGAGPSRPELVQRWAKGHEWRFTLERDKLVMDVQEEGNRFHNDIPLEQIDPYPSEEKFFPLRWPLHLLRFGVGVFLLALYAFGVWLLLRRQARPELLGAAAAAAGVAAFGAWKQLRHHRPLRRYYHRMTGAEVCAIFTDLPDPGSAGRFFDALQREIPPWSHTYSGPSKTENVARELKALHQLRQEGVLTAAEFDFKKRELLAQYLVHEQQA